LSHAEGVAIPTLVQPDDGDDDDETTRRRDDETMSRRSRREEPALRLVSRPSALSSKIATGTYTYTHIGASRRRRDDANETRTTTPNDEAGARRRSPI
jgi:hypothetical protein